MAKGGKRKVKIKGKKQHKPSKSTKKSDYYSGSERKARTCPKCGPGVFMATHKDRYHCGKCSYTEMKK